VVVTGQQADPMVGWSRTGREMAHERPERDDPRVATDQQQVPCEGFLQLEGPIGTPKGELIPDPPLQRTGCEESAWDNLDTQFNGGF